ncbi:MAG: trypsin-like peptidase domain-containing protein [Erysipelotrichaceae bacterium]|nr:trypsin-like peptidase domain-containing protein [Erysipelotrichaceae bacterium]
MRLNFKTVIIIFIVGLLGGICGTFGILEINKQTGNKIIEEDSSIVVNTVEYPTIEKSDYSIAIDRAYNSVVEITSTVEQQSFFGISTGYSLGSGVIISSDGYIVTNNHVIESAKEVSIKLYNGENYEAKLIGTDPRSDIAVIKIDAKDLEFTSIADSSALTLGQECVVIGNPLGEGISCSNGIVSALEKEITIKDYPMSVIQTNAAVNEGNSGGGLFNMNGDLIGIVNAKSGNSFMNETSVEGMGYAIPSNTVKKIVTDLVDYGYVKARATLGVNVYTQTTFDENGVKGLIVANVLKGSAADKAGMQIYDIISEVDGDEITSYAKLSKALDRHEVGDTVNVVVYRGYGNAINSRYSVYNLEKMELTVTLQEAVQE